MACSSAAPAGGVWLAAIWPDTKMNEKIEKINDWAKIIIFQNGIRFANNIFIGPKIQNHLHLKMENEKHFIVGVNFPGPVPGGACPGGYGCPVAGFICGASTKSIVWLEEKLTTNFDEIL